MEYGKNFKRFATGLAVAGLFGGAQWAHAQNPLFQDLYPAYQFDVLTYVTPNVSSAHFNGAPIGVVQGDWVQSGGDHSQQSPETVILSPGYVNHGNPGNGVVQNTIFNGPLLQQAWTSATNSSRIFSQQAASPGLTYGAVNNQDLLISESVVGNYVVDFSSTITMNQNHITFSAPAGSSFIVNIFDDVVMNGGGGGNGFLTAGGINAGNVLYNFLGSGTALSTSGSQTIDGTVLAVNGMVLTQVSPVTILGELITYQLQESSGSGVTYMPVPEPAPIALLGMCLGLFGIMRARARKV